jgi:hypothetical protein
MHTVELNTRELSSVCNWTSTVRLEHLQLCFDHGCKGKFSHEAERVIGVTGIHMSLSVPHELYQSHEAERVIGVTGIHMSLSVPHKLYQSHEAEESLASI